jgi:hypothetical protein
MSAPIPMDDLSDVSTFAPPGPDGELVVGLTPVRITGAVVVLEWILRSWFTPRGALPWNRGAGIDLREQENQSYTLLEDELLRQAMIAQARRVEYVADISVALSRAGRTLQIRATPTLVDGRSYPLALTLAHGALAIVQIGATS